MLETEVKRQDTLQLPQVGATSVTTTKALLLCSVSSERALCITQPQPPTHMKKASFTPNLVAVSPTCSILQS